MSKVPHQARWWKNNAKAWQEIWIIGLNVERGRTMGGRVKRNGPGGVASGSVRTGPEFERLSARVISGLTMARV